MPSKDVGVFDPRVAEFFTQLARHNDRGWFTEHRDEYDALVRGPLESLADDARKYGPARVLAGSCPHRAPPTAALRRAHATPPRRDARRGPCGMALGGAPDRVGAGVRRTGALVAVTVLHPGVQQ